MCGRFVLATHPDELAEHFRARLAPELGEAAEPSWNVAPSRQVLGVALTKDGERELGAYRWGLVPSYARDPKVGNRMINARAEGLAGRPAFRSAFLRRRLLVVADGFYEWRHLSRGVRQPFYFSRADGEPIAFAGLYELWRDAEGVAGEPGRWLRTCTIVTSAAGPDVAFVHDRMPVVLEAEDQDRWLAGGSAVPGDLERLLQPSPGGTLVAWPVARRVGDPRNDGPQLIDEVERVEDAGEPGGSGAPGSGSAVPGSGGSGAGSNARQALTGSAEAKTLW